MSLEHLWNPWYIYNFHGQNVKIVNNVLDVFKHSSIECYNKKKQLTNLVYNLVMCADATETLSLRSGPSVWQRLACG